MDTNTMTSTTPSVAKSDNLSKSVGRLGLTIIRAVGLPDKHLIGHNHPFLKVYLSDAMSSPKSSDEESQEGIIIRKQPATEGVDGQDPFFGSEYDIELKGDHQVLHIELWSKGMIRNSVISYLTVPITDLIKRAFDSSNIPLAFALAKNSKDYDVAGTLFLSLSYEGDSSSFDKSKLSDTSKIGEHKDTDFTQKSSDLGPLASNTINREGQRDLDTTTDSSVLSSSSSSDKTFPISSFPMASSEVSSSYSFGKDDKDIGKDSIQYGVDKPYQESHPQSISSAIDMGSGRSVTDKDVGIFNKKNIETGTMNYGPDQHSSNYNSLYDTSNQLKNDQHVVKSDTKDVSTVPDTSFNLGTNYKPETVLDAGRWGSSNVGSTGASIGSSKLGVDEKKDDKLFESSTDDTLGSTSSMPMSSSTKKSDDIVDSSDRVRNIDDKLPSLHVGTTKWGSTGDNNLQSMDTDKGVTRDKIGSSDFVGSTVGSLSSDMGTSSFDYGKKSDKIDSTDFGSSSLGRSDVGTSSFDYGKKSDKIDSTDFGSSSLGRSDVGTSMDVGKKSDKIDSTDLGSSSLGRSDVGTSMDVGKKSDVGSTDFVGSTVGSLSSDMGTSSFDYGKKSDKIDSSDLGSSKKDFSVSGENKDVSSFGDDKYRSLEHGSVWAKDNLGSGLSSTPSSSSTSDQDVNVNKKETWAEEMLHNKFKDSTSDIQHKQQPWATSSVDPLAPTTNVESLRGAMDQMNFGKDSSDQTQRSSDVPEYLSERLTRHPGIGKHQPTEYREGDEQSDLAPRQQGLGNRSVDDKLK